MLRSAPLLVIVLALSIETLHAQRPTDLVNRQFSAEVTHVADGDTVDVLRPPARRIRVRLHGVDTPESNEAFSDRARTFTRVLMFGRSVTKVYHLLSCPNASCGNSTRRFATQTEAAAAGFKPAGDCIH